MPAEGRGQKAEGGPTTAEAPPQPYLDPSAKSVKSAVKK